MPSSHALFMTTFAVYISCCFYLFRQSLKPNEKILYPLVLWAGTLSCIAGRVYLQYHYIEQVLVGAAMGLCYGLMLFGLYRSAPHSPRKFRLLSFQLKDSFWLRKSMKLCDFEAQALDYYYRHPDFLRA